MNGRWWFSVQFFGEVKLSGKFNLDRTDSVVAAATMRNGKESRHLETTFHSHATGVPAEAHHLAANFGDTSDFIFALCPVPHVRDRGGLLLFAERFVALRGLAKTVGRVIEDAIVMTAGLNFKKLQCIHVKLSRGFGIQVVPHLGGRVLASEGVAPEPTRHLRFKQALNGADCERPLTGLGVLPFHSMMLRSVPENGQITEVR